MSIKVAYKVLSADTSYVPTQGELNYWAHALEMELNHWAKEGWLLDQVASNLLILIKTFDVDDGLATGHEPATSDESPQPTSVETPKIAPREALFCWTQNSY